MLSMFKLLENAYNKIPKVYQNFLWFCIFSLILYSIFLIYSELGKSIIPWANQRKFIIVQSIGSIATAIAVIISLTDIRKRWRFEELKFHFESDPCILVAPLFTELKSLIEIDNKRQFSNYNFITINHNKFSLFNNGKGVASKIEVYICQDGLFELSETIKDLIYNLSPGNSAIISTDHFYNGQIRNLDWTRNFYIKLVYYSNYSKTRLFEDLYKAEVKEVKNIIQNFIEQQTQELFETNEIRQGSVTERSSSESHIHNIVPVKLSKR
jgi:hypothetical protein